jgi:hypothetical protein
MNENLSSASILWLDVWHVTKRDAMMNENMITIKQKPPLSEKYHFFLIKIDLNREFSPLSIDSCMTFYYNLLTS